MKMPLAASQLMGFNVTPPEAFHIEVTTPDGTQNFAINFLLPADPIIIEWGDGTRDHYSGTGIVTHPYTTAGPHDCALYGQAQQFTFQATGKEFITRILSPIRGINGMTQISGMFAQCFNVAGPIPPGFLDHVPPTINDVTYLFYNCWKLTSIPALLFDKLTALADVSSAFFMDGTHSPAAFTGPTPKNSAGLELWQLSPTPVGIDCFQGCTGLSNYAAIPAAWK